MIFFTTELGQPPRQPPADLSDDSAGQRLRRLPRYLPRRRVADDRRERKEKKCPSVIYPTSSRAQPTEADNHVVWNQRPTCLTRLASPSVARKSPSVGAGTRSSSFLLLVNRHDACDKLEMESTCTTLLLSGTRANVRGASRKWSPSTSSSLQSSDTSQDVMAKFRKVFIPSKS